MKKTILFLLLLFSTIYTQQRYVGIQRNNQGGFNIYNSQGKLLYEYNSRNTDSLMIETLNNVFFEADSKNRSAVAVINLENNELDYSNIIIACATIISGLGGLWVGYIFNIKSKKEQLKYHYKKERLISIRNNVAEYISLTNAFYIKTSSARISLDSDELTELNKAFDIYIQKSLALLLKLKTMLRKKIEREAELLLLLNQLNVESFASFKEKREGFGVILIKIENLTSELYQEGFENL